MSKTKELLEGLNQIVAKPRPFKEARVMSYTNRFYDVQKTVHQLPKHYEKSKRKKDEEGDEYIMIDRIYGSIFEGAERLIQADGTTYQGKLYKKRRLMSSKDAITREIKNFFSPCRVTADGRWFDNAGLPIDPPTKLEPEKKPDPEELELEARRKAENARAKEAEILAKLK